MIPCHLVSDLPYIRRHTRAYFRSQSRFADSHFCMIVPCYEIHVRLRILFHFIMTLPMDLPLGHFIRFTLFDVNVIFGWSRLGLMDSRIVISPGTCQIFCTSPSSCLWVIRTDRLHLMPHRGIFPPHHFLVVRHSELPCLPCYDVQSRHSQLDVHGYLV